MLQFEIPTLRSGYVYLRPLERNDLSLTLAWRNQDHIRRWFIYSSVLEPEQHAAWFEQYLLRTNDVMFIIEETKELNRPVGQVSLYDIDWKKNCAEFGRLMIGDNAARGKGVAKIATRMIVEYGFDRLGLEEIHLEVFKDNESALRIYSNVGFQIAGETNNLLHMSLLKVDFHFRGQNGV